MSLFWEQPPNTTPFPISLCIDVYNDTVDGPQFLQRQCDVPANQSRYPITVPEPDPEVLYLIVVTPRYDVTGANSGNSTNVTAFFVGGMFFYMYVLAVFILQYMYIVYMYCYQKFTQIKIVIIFNMLL